MTGNATEPEETEAIRSVSLTSVFLTGLLAGGASCAAVQGALLAGLVAQQQHAASHP